MPRNALDLDHLQEPPPHNVCKTYLRRHEDLRFDRPRHVTPGYIARSAPAR
jgi:hypothetical protein